MQNNYDIIFFNSPIYRESIMDREDYLPPLGQGYIVTQLNENGIKAIIVDCVYEKMGVEEIINYINIGNFPNIAFNIFSVNKDLVKYILENIERKINIYIGGKAVEYLWKEMICWEWKQNTVIYTIGECDTIYTDLLLGRCLEKPIYRLKNQYIYCVKKDSCYFPKDLNEIILDRNLFKNREIMNHYNRYESSIITSRGCIYNCAFCGGSVYANSSSYVRMRNIDNIKTEIQRIIEINPNVESIRVLDDLFLLNRERIFDAIKIFNCFSKLHWRAMAHINTFLKSLDLIEELKKSGCDELFVGIESGDEQMRRLIHKQGTVNDVINVIRALLQADIDVKGYFICGFPNESKKQMDKTVELALQIKKISKETLGNFRATAFQFRPYHGTELYDELKRNNKIMDKYYLENETSSKKQYSYIAGNYSNVEEDYLKNNIRRITENSNE